jgi:putative copper resistance protein D
MDEYYIAARFAHLAALTLAAGALFIKLYARPERAPAVSAEIAARFDTWLRRHGLAAAIVAFLASLAWADALAGNMSGEASGTVDPQVLRKVMFATQFGHTWIWHIPLTLVLVLALLPRRRPYWLDIATVLIAAVLLVTIADTSHAAMNIGLPGGSLHPFADRLHLLCAGFWIGGLAALAYIFVRAVRDPAWTALAQYVLPRFSRAGYGAVALLFATGCINASFLVTPGHLLTTTYGNVLLAKLAVFLLMAALAVVNRSMLTPRILVPASGDGDAAMAAFRTSVIVELSLAIVVLALVAVLGALPPAH